MFWFHAMTEYIYIFHIKLKVDFYLATAAVVAAVFYIQPLFLVFFYIHSFCLSVSVIFSCFLRSNEHEKWGAKLGIDILLLVLLKMRKTKPHQALHYDYDRNVMHSDNNINIVVDKLCWDAVAVVAMDLHIDSKESMHIATEDMMSYSCVISYCSYRHLLSEWNRHTEWMTTMTKKLCRR